MQWPSPNRLKTLWLRAKRSRAERSWNAAAQFWAAGERAKAIVAAQKAVQFSPGHLSYHLGLAEFRYANGDGQGAVLGLKSAAKKLTAFGPDRGKKIVELAAALHRNGETETAWKLLEAADPGNLAVQRLRFVIKHSQGDLDGARREVSAFFKLIDSPIFRLSLTDLMDECRKQAEVDDQEPRVAKWLWPRSGLPDAERRDWLVRLRWGLLINDIMATWIPVNRERSHELDAIIEPQDWSPYEAARKEGKFVVLVGAHLGPQLVAVRSVDLLDHPMLVVADNLTYTVSMGRKPFLSDAVPYSIVDLRNGLSHHGTVFLAGDGRNGRSQYPTKLFGSTVFLREGAAALARLCGAQTFFVAARWIDRRLKIELVQGPAPLKSESRDAWNERWFSFYMGQIERVVLAGPENIRTRCFWYAEQP